MLQEKFQSFINTHNLCDPGQDMMLAVSGGIDSVVMTDLFYRSGYNCTLLHCNFNLRGAESDGDEAFVRALSASYEIPVFVKLFDTESFANENGISIQMAARQLRYEWFEEISEKQGVEIIATAHNMNDTVETVLLNMTRGTGMKGLTGIPAKNGKFIRPMLNITRGEIIDYSRSKSIKYREDSSNASKVYHRNKIRHDIIPNFEKINPAFVHTMYENLGRISEAYQVFQEEVSNMRSKLFLRKATHLEIDLARLKKLQPLSTWLYELFSVYNFSKDQCLGIAQILDSDSGKQFISTTHRLYKDRDKMLLFEVEEETFERYYIDSPGSTAALPFPMDIDIVNIDFAGPYPSTPEVAFLDADKLSFPLTIRKWQHGDYFYPLGMEQMKKLSDFFIDTKVPVPVKKRTWILASGKHIVWIIGLRIDNRFKITKHTNEVLRLTTYLQKEIE